MPGKPFLPFEKKGGSGGGGGFPPKKGKKKGGKGGFQKFTAKDQGDAIRDAGGAGGR